MNPGTLSEEERYLSAHIADMQRLAVKSGVPRFSMFLNEREAAVARYAVRGELAFFGGYDGAARTVCGVLEGTYAQEMSLEDVFPVGAVTFTFRKSDKLTHREFLGALLSLEIKRELLGDILVAEGYAVVFVYETAIELVSRVDRIGRVGVTADVTVSSLRLDCIVAAAANTSREKSAALIKSGMVSADHTPCTNVSAELRENTILSIRGSGRYRLTGINGETRKGKFRITIEKYV